MASITTAGTCQQRSQSASASTPRLVVANSRVSLARRAGFLSDGTRIDVEKDWTDGGPRGRFLHAVALGACRYFSVVLTPATNGLHHDHLHLDIGPDRLCSVG